MGIGECGSFISNLPCILQSCPNDWEGAPTRLAGQWRNAVSGPAGRGMGLAHCRQNPVCPMRQTVPARHSLCDVKIGKRDISPAFCILHSAFALPSMCLHSRILSCHQVCGSACISILHCGICPAFCILHSAFCIRIPLLPHSKNLHGALPHSRSWMKLPAPLTNSFSQCRGIRLVSHMTV